MDRRHAASRLLVVSLLSALLVACAGTPTYVPEPRAVVKNAGGGELPTMGADVASLALRLIGTPYVYGGDDPRGFDCSGLVFYTYLQNGLAVPRTSMEQFRHARKIALSQADEGDLVFFQDEASLSHVGIYVGENMFIHAPASGRTVSLASLDSPYYQQHLVAVGRLLPN